MLRTESLKVSTWGLGFRGFGFRASGLGFGAWGLGLRVLGLGFKVSFLTRFVEGACLSISCRDSGSLWCHFGGLGGRWCPDQVRSRAFGISVGT